MQEHLVMLYWRVNYSLYVEVKQLAFNFEQQMEITSIIDKSI